MKDNRTTLGDRIADAVAAFGGSWNFIILFSSFLTGWIVINTLGFLNFMAWDKPPFILLNLILSFIASFQAPFIMMSQNRSAKKQDETYRQLFSRLESLITRDLEIDSNDAVANESIMKELQEIKEALKNKSE